MAGDLQSIVNTVWQILTSSSSDIAAQFGESRVRCDSDRINYVLELLASHVTDKGDPPSGGAPPHARHPPSYSLRTLFAMVFKETGAESIEVHSGDREPGHYLERKAFESDIEALVALARPPRGDAQP